MGSAKPALQPTILGTGLVALDLVLAMDLPPFYSVGGSCGNVLAILAHLGWNSYPISRLNDDAASKWLVEDLKATGVRTDFISRSGDGSTPVIVQRVGEDRDGNPRHRFERVCPNCNSWFPSYRPILLSRVPELQEILPAPVFFYFDRASAGALALAHWCREHGAFVIFEPPSWRDERLLREALKVSDVVKFAEDRVAVEPISVLDNLLLAYEVPLVVQTLGERGVRYRLKDTTSCWHSLDAYDVDPVVDTSGAGDWTTAGLIDMLWRSNTSKNAPFESDQVADALRFGQALAAINCLYLGARGAMDSLSSHDLRRFAKDFVAVGQTPICEIHYSVESSEIDFCPTCSLQNIGHVAAG